jgi:hypothetical protein
LIVLIWRVWGTQQVRMATLYEIVRMGCRENGVQGRMGVIYKLTALRRTQNISVQTCTAGRSTPDAAAFVRANSPHCSRAALSYASAASCSVEKTPMWNLLRSRPIAAIHLPEDLCRYTPLNLLEVTKLVFFLLA